MTKKLKSGTPFVYDENDRVVGIRDPHTGTDTDLVTAVTGPGGGIEKFTVSGIRRADGTVAPVLDTGDGWELLNGWHPRQLFEDGTPGEIFDNRSSLMYSSLSPGVSAQDGDAIALRAGLLHPGSVRAALNKVLNSENFGAWTANSGTLTQSAGDWTWTSDSGAIGYLQMSIERTAGDVAVYAVEAKMEASRWLYVGPGGSGHWFDLENGVTYNAPSSSAFAASVSPSSRSGYMWCVVARTTGEPSSTPTNIRIYGVATAPTTNFPNSGTNNGTTSITIRRAFYGRNRTAFAEADYNKTTATLPTWATDGSYCVQESESARPTLVGTALMMSSGDSMTVVFEAAPGVGSTVARAVPGLGASITAGVTVGAELETTDSDAALLVIGRALTISETRNLSDWLALRAAQEGA
jgi:hypothetical protein